MGKSIGELIKPPDTARSEPETAKTESVVVPSTATSEPAKTESAKVEPAKTEPTSTRLAPKTEPTKPDLAAKTEPADTTPAANWDDAANPYKKRYEDTRNWATKINQQLVDQKRHLDTIGKKLDGTYTEADEPTAQEAASQAALFQKVSTSNAAAERMYGKEVVQNLIWAENAPFRAYEDNPSVQARIMNAEAPVLEAIRFVQETQFFSKYGEDTEAIKKAIRSEYETELRATVDELVEERLRERLQKKDSAPSSLSTTRASTDAPKGNGQSGPTPLWKLGNPGFAAPFQRR